MRLNINEKRNLDTYVEGYNLSKIWIGVADICICIQTNNVEKLFSKYFSKKMCLPPTETNITVNVIFIEHFDEKLNDMNISGWRAKLMNEGFYISHYYGDPIKLFEHDNCMYIFGKNPDQILWRFGIKKILTIESYKRKSIHLKAAALEIKGKGYLLISPGGGGKTTFLQALMSEPEVKFLSNTHVIINERMIFGLNSNIRIRENGKENYYSPLEIFDASKIVNVAKLSGILFIKGEANKLMSIKNIDKEIATNILEYFAWGMGTYNLKMDLMEYFDYDYKKFSDYIKYCRLNSEMLAEQNCYFVRGDIFNANNRKTILESII